MKFLLLGGDGRFVRLAGSLRADGHTVLTCGLERPVTEGPVWGELAAAPELTALILPLPWERDGFINAPFAGAALKAGELLRELPPGTPVLAGKIGESLRVLCKGLGLPLTAYDSREDFALRNADLTAEGALPLLLSGEKALRDSNILILGFGRIGKRLAGKLLALGAPVTVAARSAAARTEAELMGCSAVPLGETAGTWDAVVNTVPEPVFGITTLEGFIPGTPLLELASPPYGFDRAAAEALGLPLTLAPGLPGKTAPATAAEVLKRTIYTILEENRGT